MGCDHIQHGVMWGIVADCVISESFTSCWIKKESDVSIGQKVKHVLSEGWSVSRLLLASHAICDLCEEELITLGEEERPVETESSKKMPHKVRKGSLNF